MEKDFGVAVGRLVSERKENLESTLELIARAYDPCISCSAHLINVKFV
jgi:coenzyme F420-reducing hydrogenase alpha subunit